MMGAPAKFVRKPSPCEAVQFDGSDACANVIKDWAPGIAVQYGDTMRVFTGEGMDTARCNDWIVRGEGGFYVCPNDFFIAQFQPAEDAVRAVTILNPRERDAIAVLKAGVSFDDAMRISGLTLAHVQRIWKEHGDKK